MRTLIAIVVFAAQVWAHGGGGYRGMAGVVPPGLREPADPPPPPDPCVCGRADCRARAEHDLAAGVGLQTRRTAARIVRTLGDVAEVRVVSTFRARNDGPAVEAYTVLEGFPLLAVSGGRSDATGTAALAEARTARRDYEEIVARLKDPLLVEWLGPGRLALRTYPVLARADCTVALHGYALVPAPRKPGFRLYRQGARVLVVEGLRRGVIAPACDFLDASGRRALRFLSLEAARAEFGKRLESTVEFDGVEALEAAARGAGAAAVSRDVSLFAAPAPPPKSPDAQPQEAAAPDR